MEKINPQKYSVDINGKFLFIRHGQTICNSDKNNKERKINYEYIDSHLSPKGIEQSKELKKLIAKLNIESIYVSPLYRSLETAKYIINDNYKGDIIVHPLIIECQNCIDDFIFDIKQTKNDFKNLNVNWNIFDEYVNENKKWNENFFYFDYFNCLEENQKIEKYNKLFNLFNKGDMNTLKKEIVNEIPKIIFNNNSFQPFESFKHVYSRFLTFKEFLLNKHKYTLNDSNQKVLVITHGDYLTVITNKYLFDDDKINFFPKDCCYCKNCDIISLYL